MQFDGDSLTAAINVETHHLEATSLSNEPNLGTELDANIDRHIGFEREDHRLSMSLNTQRTEEIVKQYVEAVIKVIDSAIQRGDTTIDKNSHTYPLKEGDRIFTGWSAGTSGKLPVLYTQIKSDGSLTPSRPNRDIRHTMHPDLKERLS